MSESSLKRWADEGMLAAERTAGGHRRIAIAEAVRFIRERRLPVARPELLGFGGVERRPAAEGFGLADGLFDAFARDDQAGARAVLLGAFLDGAPIVTLCDGPVRLALERLGELWKHGPAGIVLEHRAVVTTVQALDAMRAALPATDPGAPVALGGALAGDPYVLPSMAAALALAELGFAEVNLGADVPTEPLLEAIDRYRPALVWRTVSCAETGGLRGDLERLARRLESTTAHVVVGGRQSAGAAAVRHDRVHHLGSMAELVGFARGLLATRRKPTPDNAAAQAVPKSPGSLGAGDPGAAERGGRE